MRWYFDILAIGLTLFGLILNAQRKKDGFYLWLITNGYWFLYAAGHGDGPMAVLFGLYWLSCLYGLHRWSMAARPEVKLRHKLKCADICIAMMRAKIENLERTQNNELFLKGHKQ